MTIDAQVTELTYAGDGITTVFPIPFPFDTAEDIKVTATDATGTAAEIVSGFSITGGGGSTGNLVFTTAPATGVSITVLDDPAFTQPTDYQNNDAFPAEAHERALDRVTRLCKRLLQLVGRSLRFPDGDPTSAVELASVDTRKGKYLFFNAVTGAIEYAVALATTTLSQSIIGQLLNPQTPEEVAAGIVPLNYWYEPGNIKRYGAVVDGVADDTVAVQKAFDVAKFSSGRVASVFFPAGPGAKVTAPILYYKNMRIHGDGMNNSFCFGTHNGSIFQSAVGVKNAPTGIFLTIENLGVTTTAGAASNGAAIEDLCGSLIAIKRCYFYNFKYGVILDQSENVSITESTISSTFTTSKAGIWLTNGADRTAGANTGFTNRVTVDRCNFNFPVSAVSVAVGILDDGGGNHAYTNNNFSGGLYGMRIAGVGALTISNHEHENHYAGNVLMDEYTDSGAYVGGSYGFSIQDSVMIAPGTSGGNALGAIIIKSARKGVISGNVFGEYSTGAVYFPNTGALAFNTSSGIVLGPNCKVVTGTAKTIGPMYAAQNGSVLKSCQIIDGAETYVLAGLTAGSNVTVTPKSMEGLHVGSRLTCRNADGTNAEVVLVKTVGASSFTADFASDKAANWFFSGGLTSAQIAGSGAFSASTTVTVNFNPTNEYDGNYRVLIVPTSAPAGLWHVPLANKTSSSFQVTCASSGSWSFDWFLVRD